MKMIYNHPARPIPSVNPHREDLAHEADLLHEAKKRGDAEVEELVTEAQRRFFNDALYSYRVKLAAQVAGGDVRMAAAVALLLGERGDAV